MEKHATPKRLMTLNAVNGVMSLKSVVFTVNILQGPQNTENFLIRCSTISLSRRTLHRRVTIRDHSRVSNTTGRYAPTRNIAAAATARPRLVHVEIVARLRGTPSRLPMSLLRAVRVIYQIRSRADLMQPPPAQGAGGGAHTPKPEPTTHELNFCARRSTDWSQLC
jgi:hypothetical protein